ncbi:MAG: hypothetical protein WD846_01355 [Patescibacteria group bacterium]
MDHPEPHPTEALEQALSAHLEALRVATHCYDHEHAKEIAGELATYGQPDEFRLEGLFALGELAEQEHEFDEALAFYEEARQLAVSTESYERAADIQRSVGWLYRNQLGDRERAREAFMARNEYSRAAKRFPPRRFGRLVSHDDD